MNEASLSPGRQRLIQQFKDAGGVVDYVVLELSAAEEEKNAEEHTHHQAIVVAMEFLKAKVDEWAVKTSREHSIPRSKIFKVQLDHQKAQLLKGRRIDERRFLGSRYHHERKGLIVRGELPFQSEFFLFSDPSNRENIIDRASIDNGIGTGYAYAFSDPPYRVRLAPKATGELFAKVNTYVLGGIFRDSIIFEWPTDWSNYFDAGHEWWGSFLYSFANPHGSNIIVIAASTTD
jgi:hypothetical protein